MKFLLILLNVYFVSFSDKPEKTVPQLSPRAIEQRAKWGIENDIMDYPVSPMYLNQLRDAGAKICHYSRWFNGATCEMDATTYEAVEQLPFVVSIELTRDNSPERPLLPKRRTQQRRLASVVRVQESEAATTPYTDAQLAVYNLHPLHEAGFTGQKILMAICDGGFQEVNTMTGVFRQALELGHFDFTDDSDDFYGSTGSHGTECLSTISAIGYNSAGDLVYTGAATSAEYYLMRSEESEHESQKEMDNLVVALEKADSLGANIFSVSLGYCMFDNYNDLTYSDLDGNTTRCSRAATIAARKGMLVCVAAGNEGNDPWHYISAPADADSILTVGAVNVSKQIAGFSSYGPAADGRIKPDVCAVGKSTYLVTPPGYLIRSDGTSYATPLIAGMAACLWSALPDENAMQIRERIIRSADRYTNPSTDRYGYGIPDAWEAYQMDLPMGVEETLSPDTNARKILLNGQIRILRDGRTYDILGTLLH